MSCYCIPPPAVPFAFERTFLRVFRGSTDIGWIMTHFRKTNPYGFEIKSCHRWADIYFAWRIFSGSLDQLRRYGRSVRVKPSSPPEPLKTQKCLFIYFMNKLLLRNIKFKEPDKNCTSVKSFRKWALSYFLLL